MIFTAGDEVTTEVVVPDSIYTNGHFHDCIYSAANLAQMILRQVNLCTVAVPIK